MLRGTYNDWANDVVIKPSKARQVIIILYCITEKACTILELKTILGLNDQIYAPQPMTLVQLKELSSNPLNTIGLHTHKHLSLPFHSFEVQKKDLVQNKDLLEKTCSVAINSLSYPHGLFNEETLSIVKELQLKVAFTTQPVSIGKTVHKYQVGRYQAFNWNENEFKVQLKRMFYA